MKKHLLNQKSTPFICLEFEVSATLHEGYKTEQNILPLTKLTTVGNMRNKNTENMRITKNTGIQKRRGQEQIYEGIK